MFELDPILYCRLIASNANDLNAIEQALRNALLSQMSEEELLAEREKCLLNQALALRFDIRIFRL